METVLAKKIVKPIKTLNGHFLEHNAISRRKGRLLLKVADQTLSGRKIARGLDFVSTRKAKQTFRPSFETLVDCQPAYAPKKDHIAW